MMKILKKRENKDLMNEYKLIIINRGIKSSTGIKKEVKVVGLITKITMVNTKTSKRNHMEIRMARKDRAII